MQRDDAVALDVNEVRPVLARCISCISRLKALRQITPSQGSLSIEGFARDNFSAHENRDGDDRWVRLGERMTRVKLFEPR
jgi:hypothetical protein